MAATLTVVNLNGQTLAQYTLQTGNAQSIAAMDNVHYQLADAQSVEAGRAGDDLVVRIQGEPALIIEDYFLLDDSGLKNPLLGLNGSGQYVAYPIGDTSALPVEHLLAEEVIASSAGAAINPAIALAAIGGVALTGAVIVGSGKDNDKTDNDTPQQPQTPFDPNQPEPPLVDNGNTTPPPSGGGNTNPPPSGGGSTNPPPSGGGNTNPPPAGGGNTNPPPPQPGNTAPGDITLSANRLPESQPGAIVGKLSTTDADANDSHTYTVSDQRFEVDAQGNLKLKDGVKVDFANEPNINLTVTVSDRAGASYSEAFTLQVQDDPNYPAPTPPQNQAPTDLDLSANGLPENVAGAVIGKLTVTDPDANDSHTYAVSDNRFEVDAQGNLKLKDGVKVEFAQEKTISLQITTTDKGGEKYSETFTLQVQDDPNYPAPTQPANQAPADIQLSAVEVMEGKAGIVIGRLTTVDPDQSDTHTYTVDDNRFEIDAQGNLKLKAGQILNYDDAQSITVNITSHDGKGGTFRKAFIIAVQDDPAYPAPQNHAPTDLDLPILQLPENTPGAVIGQIMVTDPDGNDSHTFAVNDPRFEITTGGILKLKAGEKIDYADAQSVPLTITVTDKAGASYQETFTIVVQDDPNYPAPTPPANQAPTDITLSANELPENQAGAIVGKLSTTDADTNDSHTYTVSDQRFEVDAQGNLKLKDGVKVEFAQEKTINLQITTNDGKGGSYREDFTLQVEDDPNYPAPTPQPNQPGSIAISGEAQSGQTLTATVTDGNGVPNAIQYQWFADGIAIQGATQSTFTLTHAQVGKILSVTATYSDVHGHGETPQSALTDAVRYGVHEHPEYGRYVDVREFGADASGAQSSDAAVKAALAAAQQEGASLYFGEGQYRLTDPIRLNDGLSNVGGIFGAGMDKTTLHYANEVYSALTVNNLDGKKIGDFTLAIDTTFYQPGVARLGPVSGIMVLDSAQTTVQRVDVSGANGAGVRFAGDRAKHEPDIRKLLNGDITADELDLGRGNQLIDSHLHHNRHSGVLIEFQEHFTARGNTFARNGHEKDGNIGYGLALGVGSYNRHVNITGNTTDHNYRKGLDVHDGDHIVMKGNTLKGDRLFGIAITSRTFALREVEVADNTLILDPAFHRFTDDNRSNDFNDYLGIEVQTNYERQNFPDSRPANITIANNRIENLFDPGTGSSLSHGIVVRHNSQSAQYAINIRDNHLSGQGADHAIAVFNDSGAPGALDIDNNTINIANLAHAPIRVHNSADGSGQALSGSLNVRGNTVHLGGADNSAEFLLVENHRAQDYDIRGNTLRFDDRVDQPLIILRSGDYSGKADVGIIGNHMHTPLAELPKNWIRGDEHTNIAQQNNTHNGQPIDAGNAAPDAIRAFAEAHIPQGASYVVAGAGGGVARVILAEYEADHGQRPDYLIISDGSHHALVQQGSGGSDINLPGWSADFAKAGYIPMTAYYQNDAAQALNQALAEAARLKLGVEMPDNGSFTLTAPVTVTNGVQYLHGNGATLAVQLADTGSNAAPRGAIEIAKGTQNADISGIKLDMAGAAGAEGILGYDAAHIHIHHNTIANLAGRPGNAAAGVTFYNGETHVHDIRVEHNRIYAQTGSESNKGQVNGVSFVGTTAPHNPAYLKGGDPIWQQYIEDGSVRPLDSDRTMKNIAIQGNHIEGGYYGVNLFAVTDSLVQSNHIGNNTRNISLQNNAARNTVADNLLTDSLSSAVHLAYNADHNTVRGNLIISDRLSGQALLQAYQGSEHNTFAGNRIEALHNAAARLMYTGSNDGGNRFTNNIASGRTAASAFGAEAVWDKESAGGDPSAYASNMQDPNLYAGEIRHGGGFGPMRDTVFSNNILAPEITQRPVTPIIYLAADHSQGQDGGKNIRGDLDITLNGNILLGADNAPETIRQHQNGATITLGGDGVLRDADGVYQSSQHIAYSIRDYQMGDADQHLYLLGNDAVSGTGNAADNTIIGNGRANTLNGGEGNDTLDGGYGADTLTGGKGADTFVFQSKTGAQNLDTITDFNRAEGDKIALSEVLFGKLEGDWFAQDGATHSAQTRIYQQGQMLYHDPDGAGGSAAQAFANVGAAKLDAADFAILNHLLIV